MDELDRYILAHSSPEDDLLRELDRETHRRTVHPQMVSGPVQGKFLEMIVRMIRPRRVLEIGTFTGYSALSMAAGLPDDGVIDTVEVSDEKEALIRSFLDRSPHGHKIRLHIGSALQVVPQLSETYDLVFIDGDKREYPAYYRMLMGDGVEDAENASRELSDAGPLLKGEKTDRSAPKSRPPVTPPLLRSGSYILADNILWYGKVGDPEAYHDPMTSAILEFNRMIREDHRVENVILPIRDGINLIRVK